MTSLKGAEEISEVSRPPAAGVAQEGANVAQISPDSTNNPGQSAFYFWKSLKLEEWLSPWPAMLRKKRSKGKEEKSSVVIDIA